MNKFRAALAATALVIVAAGSTGMAATSQAAPSDVTPVVAKLKGGGDGWCC